MKIVTSKMKVVCEPAGRGGWPPISTWIKDNDSDRDSDSDSDMLILLYTYLRVEGRGKERGLEPRSSWNWRI
jgi:hypothetical protein